MSIIKTNIKQKSDKKQKKSCINCIICVLIIINNIDFKKYDARHHHFASMFTSKFREGGGFMGGVHMCSYGGSLLASLHTKVSAFIIII